MQSLCSPLVVCLTDCLVGALSCLCNPFIPVSSALGRIDPLNLLKQFSIAQRVLANVHRHTLTRVVHEFAVARLIRVIVCARSASLILASSLLSPFPLVQATLAQRSPQSLHLQLRLINHSISLLLLSPGTSLSLSLSYTRSRCM